MTAHPALAVDVRAHKEEEEEVEVVPGTVPVVEGLERKEFMRALEEKE